MAGKAVGQSIAEDPGLYIDVLTDLGIRLRLVHEHREPIPTVTDCDVMCPAVRADRPCFGICCGAELPAIAFGGARPSPVVEIGATLARPHPCRLEPASPSAR